MDSWLLVMYYYTVHSWSCEILFETSLSALIAIELIFWLPVMQAWTTSKCVLMSNMSGSLYSLHQRVNGNGRMEVKHRVPLLTMLCLTFHMVYEKEASLINLVNITQN